MESPFRKNSFFTPTVKEIEYQESVREHALRAKEAPPREEKRVDIAAEVDRALDERDSRS